MRGVLAALLLLGALLAGCAGEPASVPAGSVGDDGPPAVSPTAAPTPPRPTPVTPTRPSTPPQTPGQEPDPEPQPGQNGTPSQGEPEPVPARSWAPLDTAMIRPGTQVDDGNCTTNFVFTSLDNLTVYIGTAAHCFGNGLNTETNGCQQATAPDPLGTTATIDGATVPATLVYSSWLTMIELGETSDDRCFDNDFALLELSPGDAGKVNPAMLHFGGPIGVADPNQPAVGDKVITYGNSGTRNDIDELSPHEGYMLFPPAGGWSSAIYTVGPGIPGDSGSGVMMGDGRALGIMVHLNAVPPAGNGVTTLALALDYACQQGGFCVQLATWDLIDPGLLPGV